MNTNNTFPNPFEQDPLPQWDKNGVWDQIEAQLPPRKRRPVFWWWWFGAGSLVAVALYSAAGWWHSGNHATTANTAPQTVVSGEKTPHQTTDQPLRTAKKPEPKAAQPTTTLPSSNEGLLPNNQKNTPKTPKTTPITRPIAAHDPLSASNLAVNTTTTPSGVAPNGSTGPVPAMMTILPAPLPDRITRQTPDPLPNLATFPTDTALQTRIRPGFQWLFSMDAGATFRNTTARSAAGAPFAEAHQRAVRPLETVAVQAGMQYHIRPKWAIGAGLRYQSTQHWFRFTETTVQTEQITSDSASFYQFNGVTYYQSGTVNQTTTSTRAIVSPGRTERIFVPIWVNMAFNQRFYGQLGLLLNVHNRYRGFALNPQGIVLAKNDRQGIAELYQKAGAHSARIELGYRLVQHGPWQLRAGVHYQTDLGSVLAPATQVRQRDQILGVTLSVLR
jgi:cytoskeletal protein RodZ